METGKRQTIIMEAALADGGKLLMFVDRPIYDHTDTTLKGVGGDFYYYDMHTCPVNWLREVGQIAYVSPEGQVEMDPHGVLHFAGAIHNTEAPDGCMERDDYYLGMACGYVRGEKQAVEFLDGISSGMSNGELRKRWLEIISSTPALISLAKNLVIRDEELVLEVTKMGYNLSLLGGCPFLDVGFPPTDEYDRVKVIAESEVLQAGWRGQ